MKDKISIIIPIYNVAKYLPKCIDSILNQTYKNLEIILVDDGSTDESGKICDEYSYKNNRIKVIHKQNGGSSDARNAGLRAATGKYIGFVDSDDFIETDMYEILLKTLYAYDADIAECAFYRINEDNIILPKYYSGTIEEFDASSALEETIRHRRCVNMVWNKIYKKDLLQGIEFPLYMYSEDVAFTYKVFARAQKIISIDIPKYYFLKHKDSISKSLVYLNRIDWIYGYLEKLEFISKNFPPLFNLQQKMFFIYLLGRYKKIETHRHLDKYKKNRNLIKNYIKTNYMSLTSNPLIDRKIKLFLKIFKINFWLGYHMLDFDDRLRKKIIRMLEYNSWNQTNP